LPDVLDRVEFEAARRQRQQRDVVGHSELGGGVPASLVEHEDGVGAGIDGQADLLEMRGYGFCGASGQNEACALSLGRADRSEDVG
jgi:hypothetical protein